MLGIRSCDSSNAGGDRQPTAVGKPASLWDQAYARFASSNPKLDDAFREIVAAEVKAADKASPTVVPRAQQPVGSKQTEFMTLIESKIERMRQREWKIRLGTKFNVGIRDLAERILSILDAVRDLGSQAASLDPVHAGLPVAALYMILGFVSADKKSREALFYGLERVSDIVRYYAVVEKVYLIETTLSGSQALEQGIVTLYELILEFEALAVCQCDHNTAYQTWRNMFGRTSWKDRLTTVEAAGEECKLLLPIVHHETESARRQEFNDICGKQSQNIEQYVRDSAELYKQLLEESRHSLKAQLSMNEQGNMRKCMQALRTTEYEATKRQIPNRVPDTCGWFLQHSVYKKWIADQPVAIMWLTANPGCGKSVLSKYLVDEFTDIAGDETSVCYFFFKARGEAEVMSNALCALLHQLFKQNETLLKKHGLKAFALDGKNFAAYCDPLWCLLEAASTDEEAGSIIYILDGLDECENGKQKELISRLFAICCKARPNQSIKLLVTGRPIDVLRDAVKDAARDTTAGDKPGIFFAELAAENHAESDAISEEIDIVINDYVRSFKERREELVRDDAHLILRDELTRFQNRTYLWISLVFPRVLENVKAPREELVDIIRTTPETVDAAYQAILDRVPASDVSRFKTLMQVVMGSARDLTLCELKAALSMARGKPYQELEKYTLVEKSSEGDSNPAGSKTGKPRLTEVESVDLKLFREHIRKLGSLFIRITQDDHVVLIHETAADFLLAPNADSTPPSHSGSWKHSFDQAASNLILASSCIWYLSLPKFDETWLRKTTKGRWGPHGANLAKFLEQHGFLEYAASYWTRHFNLSGHNNPSDMLTEEAARLCRHDSDRFRTWSKVYWSMMDRSMPQTTTDLNVAAGYGLVPVIHYMVNHGADVNSVDDDGDSALHAAALHQQPRSVAPLLERGANLDVRAHDGNTPLSSAAARGLTDMTQTLLDRGADKCVVNDEKRTPLHRAALYGHQGVVQILLKAGAPVNVRDKQGRTPLHLAVMMGIELPKKTRDLDLLRLRYVECVKLLVREGAADLNAKDGREDDVEEKGEKGEKEDGRTPLQLFQDCSQNQSQWDEKARRELEVLLGAPRAKKAKAAKKERKKECSG